MLIFLTTLLASWASIFRSRASLALENLALRHQIGVLHRSAGKRPKLTAGDRLLWICLSRLWRDWRSALAIVKPETVVAWHRSPITRAPTSAVSSPVTRLAGLSQGRSRITKRSPVTGFSQTSPTFMGLRSGAPFGSGCDIRAQVSHRGRLVGNFSPIQ